jgi:hypothetical protein
VSLHSPTGRITILWRGASQQLLAVTGSAGGTFSAPRPIAHGARLGEVAVVVTPRDQVIAVWDRERPDGGDGTIEGTTSKDGARFGKPLILSKRNARIKDCFGPSLTVARTGAAMVESECLTSTPERPVDEFARFEP